MVEQRGSEHHAYHYPRHDAPGSHAAKENDGSPDQNHQRRDFPDGARDGADKGIKPGNRLAGGIINQRYTATSSPL
jgi:hypothetical protein